MNKGLLKVTKILNLKSKENEWTCTGIHFSIDGKNYFLHYGCYWGESFMTLYEGRMLHYLKEISSCSGHHHDLIRFKRRPRCLSDIDKEWFFKRMEELGLLNFAEEEGK